VPGDRGRICRAPTKMLRADKLEEQWSAIVSDIELQDDWRRRIEDLAGDGKEREAVIE
jgi:hypothetical protein